MNDVLNYFLIAVGVACGVVYPVLLGRVRGFFPSVAASGNLFQRLWRIPWVRKSALLAAFSLVAALVVLAIFRSMNPNAIVQWYTAVLLGFGFEATIEKAYKNTVKPDAGLV